MKKIIEEIIDFRDQRDWEQFHTAENLAKSISIEAAELLELFRFGNENINFEEVKDELADVLTYCLLLSERCGLKVEEIIRNKMKKNAVKYPVDKVKGSSVKYNKLKL